MQGEARDGPEGALWGPRTEGVVHLVDGGDHGQGAWAEGYIAGDIMSSWKQKWGVLDAAAGTGRWVVWARDGNLKK